MKKVCFFISSISQAGGTGRVCTEIANKLSGIGYQVTILSLYGEIPFFELNPAINVVAAFRKKYSFKLFLPYVVLGLRRKITAISPDVLINVDSALFIYSIVSGMGLNIKNVVWEHFNYNYSLNSLVRVISRKLAARYSDAIITLTHKDNSNWKTNLTCISPVFTINNPSPFTNKVNTYQDPKPIVLSVGRLTPQKGFDRLLDAWQIVKMNDHTEWVLHIIGSGDLKEELETQLRSLNLTASVKLIPVTADIRAHYKEAGLYCMTSRFEGFPMVLLEAQSFGLPMISYDCETGPSEIINNENGILVKNDDKYALADALIYLMKNKDERLRLSARSFQNSFNYSIDVIIKSWINLLEIHLQ